MADAWDVVVVGGGIHGVGVAQAAAAAGHRALVLERTGLAAGTSSRSSKLIHGGLRYLEHGEIALVRECLRERRILLEIAPDLVRLRPFFFPVYRTSRRRPLTIRLGLSLYALLGGLRAPARFASLPRRAWGDLDGLATDGLRAVYAYRDGQTDDAMLTAAVMASAESLGAELAAPAEMIAASVRERDVVVRYRRNGRDAEVVAAALVNAAGPWVNRVVQRIEPRPPSRRVDLVQGTHIRVPGALTRGIYYVEAPSDGRAVFVMPWNGDTLVGTTERTHHGDPADAAPTTEETDYLRAVLHHHFPRYGADDPGVVADAFAGLRVLPADDGAATGRTRETILAADRPDAPRVLSIYGGKLTAYRATAEKVMAALRPGLPARTPVADTRRLPLTPV